MPSFKVILGIITLLCSTLAYSQQPNDLNTDLRITEPAHLSHFRKGESFRIVVVDSKGREASEIILTGPFQAQRSSGFGPWSFDVTVDPSAPVMGTAIRAVAVLDDPVFREIPLQAIIGVTVDDFDTDGVLQARPCPIQFQFPGESYALSVSAYRAGGAKTFLGDLPGIVFTPVDTSIVTMVPNAIAVAKKPGTTRIDFQYQRMKGSCQITVLDRTSGDFTGNSIISRGDLAIIRAPRAFPGTFGWPYDARDINRDGKITIDDVRALAARCTYKDCASNAAGSGARVDPDDDFVESYADNCPDVSNPEQEDSDEDRVGDACDGCPKDQLKTLPLLCGCGVKEGECGKVAPTETPPTVTPTASPTVDSNAAAVLQLRGKASILDGMVKRLKLPRTKKELRTTAALKKNLTSLIREFESTARADSGVKITVSGGKSYSKVVSGVSAAVRKLLRMNKLTFAKDRKRAIQATAELKKVLN